MRWAALKASSSFWISTSTPFLGRGADMTTVNFVIRFAASASISTASIS